ncbi:MAG: ISAs1 family transposase [Endozoicomonadaceae bacterium]|nr:ISAs1 family transposase [Endozoicomonadaceae bacterium]
MVLKQNNRLILGQCRSKEKKNEIFSAVKLIEILELKQVVVTMDTMHCQKKTASTIIKQKGDYVLSLKKKSKTTV